MRQIDKQKLSDLFHNRVGRSFIFSYIFFLICMALDFYMTTIGSGGDWTMEANTIARLWWQIMGPFRFIEIPIWAAFVLFVAFFVNIKSKFIVLLWLNVLAFNHLFGFITWLPYDTYNFVNILSRWATTYPIGLMSLIASLPLTLIQLFIKPKYNKR